MNVYVSMPGTSAHSTTYQVNVGVDTSSTAAATFVTAWYAANIPYTTATVTTDGLIQLTHTAGGLIDMDDFVDSSFARVGSSNGLAAAAGAEEGDQFAVVDGEADIVHGGHLAEDFANVLELNTHQVKRISRTFSVFLDRRP